MKYKVGDKVRVREDLEVGKMYGNYEFKEAMKEFKGKLAIIQEVWTYHNDLDRDYGENFWTDEMLEPVAESIAESKEFTKEDLKFGDIVTLRNGEQYIYIDKKIVNEKDYEYWIETYNKDFSYEDEIERIPDLDIMKVERIIRENGRQICRAKTLYERKEILTEEEKEYLQEIINIFSEKVYSIERDDDSNIIFYFSSSLARQPMDLYKLKYKYKKMEENHKYTLEELGI